MKSSFVYQAPSSHPPIHKYAIIQTLFLIHPFINIPSSHPSPHPPIHKYTIIPSFSSSTHLQIYHHSNLLLIHPFINIPSFKPSPHPPIHKYTILLQSKQTNQGAPGNLIIKCTAVSERNVIVNNSVLTVSWKYQYTCSPKIIYR